MPIRYIRAIGNTFSSAFSQVGMLKNKYPEASSLYLYLDLVYYRLVKGYDFDDYVTFDFYSKSRKERKKYLSFRENSKLAYSRIQPQTVALFLDKIKFNCRFEKYIQREWANLNEMDKDQIIAFIKRHSAVIVKPVNDYGGAGIAKIDSNQPDIESTIEELIAEMNQTGSSRKYIIEECIENSPEIKCIAPGSLNTLRIVTVIDRSGDVHIPAALLRVGSGTSVMDNYHSGGMACPIDLTTGRLTAEACGEYNKRYTSHPYTGTVFKDYHIPEFKKILEIAQEVALFEPSARYVGWDFALTPDGIELLEGNIPPGEHITQLASGPIRERLHHWIKG